MKPSSESHARASARQIAKRTAAVASETAPTRRMRRREQPDGQCTLAAILLARPSRARDLCAVAADAIPALTGGHPSMKIKAENGLARILKAEGIPWVSCYPTSNVNNALGEEGVPILMMGEERFAVAVADAFSRVTCGKQIGACTVMAGLNAAGIQMAYGAVAQAWEDSSPLLVMAEGVGA